MSRRAPTSRPPRPAPLRRWALLLLLAAAVAPAAAGAAEVSFDVSPRETWVGSPVTVTVEITDAESYAPPSLDDVEGFDVDPGPGTSTRQMTNIVNGRVTTTKTTVLTYRLVPRREGILVIPPLTVVADGREFASRPTRIAVVRSESGDLLFVEVDASRDEIYLGQRLDLKLRIWIRPYADRRYDLRLGEADMWSLVSDRAGSLGPFAEALEEMRSRRQRPRGREVLRPDASAGADGSRAYYLYDIDQRIWPDSAGPLDLGEITVSMEYPIRLERSRDIFGRGELRLEASRPVRATARLPDVTVLPPPEANRPPWFAGAVGLFDFDVSARPTEVAVGDPITLSMEIRDDTPGGSRLDLLRPPPLARVEALTDRFRIPSDPLAGVVDGRVKRFTQTIRATSDDVDEIPPIPFTFFDPRRERYVTVHSDPIPLVVEPATTVDVGDVVAAEETAAPRPTALTDLSGGLLANYAGQETLLASRSREGPGWWWLVVAGPPLLSIGALLAHGRRRRLREDVGYARRRRARREAERRLATARGADGVERVEMIGEAVSGYVADRCNLPPGAVTRADVVRTLDAGAAPRELVEEVGRLILECEQHRYAGRGNGTGEELARRAETVIRRLERERLP